MLFVLDTNERVVGVLDNNAPLSCHYFNDRFTENINDNLSVLEFEVSNNHETADLLQVEGYIIYTDLDNKQKLFIVKEIQDRHDTVKTKTIYCEAAATGELVGSIVRPVSYVSFSLENILSAILQGTNWEIGTIEFSETKDIEFTDYITSLEALHQVVNLFGGEMEYQVIFNGSQVVKRQINILQRRGIQTGKIFEYTKNLNSIQRVEDTRNLVTALIGIGKADAEGNLLTLSGHTPLSVPDGYALTNDYIENKKAFQLYNKSGRHIFGVFKDDTATNKTELYNNTLSKLQNLSKPKLTYTCDVVSLERLTDYSHESVRIGDTILVKDFTYDSPIVLSARVIELVRSLNNPLNDVVTLGDYRPINIQGSNSELEDLKNLIFNNQNIWSSSGEVASEALIEARAAQAAALEAAQKALAAEQNASDALAKAELVDELEGQLTATDLKIASWAAANDTTMIDGAKIYTGTVTAEKINALGLNINNQFVVSNSGNVTFSGNLSGASGSFSSNGDANNTATIANGTLTLSSYQGANLTAYAQGSEAGIYFTYSSYSSYISFYLDTITLGNNVSIGNNLTVSGSTSLNGTANFYGSTYFSYEPYTRTTETGFCGLGGYCSTSSGVQFGTGVNFRVKKTYTPSSITLNATSETLSGNPLVTNITQNGFWLYFQNEATGLRYWRGTYTG